MRGDEGTVVRRREDWTCATDCEDMVQHSWQGRREEGGIKNSVDMQIYLRFFCELGMATIKMSSSFYS